jgi:hypothetical protein
VQAAAANASSCDELSSRVVAAFSVHTLIGVIDMDNFEVIMVGCLACSTLRLSDLLCPYLCLRELLT